MKFWVKNLLAMLLGLGACTGNYFVSRSSFDKILYWESERADIRYAGANMYPVARFVHDGKEYNVRLSSKPPNNDRSGVVIFPKDDPSKAEVKNLNALVGIPLTIAFAGLLFIVIGFFSMQNRITGKKIPPPSYDANRAFTTLQDYVKMKDQQIRDRKKSSE